MKSIATEFKLGGLHEKHVMATWNLGNHLSICFQAQENQEKPVSRWQVAGPSEYWLLASSPASIVMPTRYNKYTLDNNNTQPTKHNYSQDNLKLATYTRGNLNFIAYIKSKNTQARQLWSVSCNCVCFFFFLQSSIHSRPHPSPSPLITHHSHKPFPQGLDHPLLPYTAPHFTSFYYPFASFTSLHLWASLQPDTQNTDSVGLKCLPFVCTTTRETRSNKQTPRPYAVRQQIRWHLAVLLRQLLRHLCVACSLNTRLPALCVNTPWRLRNSMMLHRAIWFLWKGVAS